MAEMNIAVMTNERNRNERGVTLVELAIAIMVLTIGLTAIVGVSAYVSRANMDSSTLSILATAAQNQVDVLRSATWNVYTCDASLAVDSGTGIGGSLTSNVANYNTTVTGTPAGNLTVRWELKQGGTADYRYVTIRVAQSSASRDLGAGYSLTTIIRRQ